VGSRKPRVLDAGGGLLPCGTGQRFRRIFPLQSPPLLLTLLLFPLPLLSLGRFLFRRDRHRFPSVQALTFIAAAGVEEVEVLKVGYGVPAVQMVLSRFLVHQLHQHRRRRVSPLERHESRRFDCVPYQTDPINKKVS